MKVLREPFSDLLDLNRFFEGVSKSKSYTTSIRDKGGESERQRAREREEESRRKRMRERKICLMEMSFDGRFLPEGEERSHVQLGQKLSFGFGEGQAVTERLERRHHQSLLGAGHV